MEEKKYTPIFVDAQLQRRELPKYRFALVLILEALFRYNGLHSYGFKDLSAVISCYSAHL